MKFNILEIAKTVGSELIRNFIPGGSVVVSAINALLPDGKELKNDATGLDINEMLDSLPIDQRAKMIEHKFDIDETWIKESSSCLQAAIEADTKTPHTTRPKIALGCFRVLAFTNMSVIGAWVYAVVAGNDLMIAAIMGGWPFILSIDSVFASVLLAYFGKLTKEHKERLDAAQGISQPSGIVNKLLGLLK